MSLNWIQLLRCLFDDFHRRTPHHSWFPALVTTCQADCQAVPPWEQTSAQRLRSPLSGVRCPLKGWLLLCLPRGTAVKSVYCGDKNLQAGGLSDGAKTVTKAERQTWLLCLALVPASWLSTVVIIVVVCNGVWLFLVHDSHLVAITKNQWYLGINHASLVISPCTLLLLACWCEHGHPTFRSGGIAVLAAAGSRPRDIL